MKFGWVLSMASLCAVAGWAAEQMQVGRNLPKVKLERVLPEIKLDRPLWMEEVAGQPNRFFIIEQDGRISVLANGSDGKDARIFLNIVDRKPHVDNEEGLLGLAFYPGF